MVVASAGWLRGNRGSRSNHRPRPVAGRLGPAGVTSAAYAARRATRDSATEGEVADNKRRGEDAGDDRLDDEIVDDVADDDANDADEPVSRGGTATRARARAESADSRPTTRSETGRVGVFGRIARFFREVVAELRKVIWPTRKELLTYTAVVVTFVAVMLTIVGVLDYGFAKAVLFVFGNSD